MRFSSHGLQHLEIFGKGKVDAPIHTSNVLGHVGYISRSDNFSCLLVCSSKGTSMNPVPGRGRGEIMGSPACHMSFPRRQPADKNRRAQNGAASGFVLMSPLLTLLVGVNLV